MVGKDLLKILKESKYTTVLSGFEMLQENGYPAIRDGEESYDIEQKYGYSVDEMFTSAFYSTRKPQFFEFYRNELLSALDIPPGKGYLEMAELEEKGLFQTIITRRVFGLPERAGCKNVINLHGSVYENYCPHCGKKYPVEYIREAKRVPLCTECNAPIRPGVCLMGEKVDNKVITKAADEVQKADVLLVLGTNLKTYLCTQLINYYEGDKLIVVNPEPHFSDKYADILVSERVDITLEKILKELGEVEVYDRTSYEESPLIAERIGDAEIVVINKTPVSRETMDKCENIKLIAVLATGYNVVDYAYAKEKGIPVVNVPTYGTQIVGQYAVGLLLEICSHYGHHDATVKEGKWENNDDWCYWDYPLIELEGKTIGIIGFGRIGQTEGRIAKALGMNVIAYDLHPNDSGRAIAEYVELDALYQRADVITLHCNLTPENTGMINKESIAKMKDGVILINNARGQLIVEQDVVDALNGGKIGAAGLDVVYTEPIKVDNPLLKAKNCIITPHISWAPKESRQRIMDCTVDNVRAYLQGAPINVVNP